MKNKLSDLNDHLFAQMERLANEELTPEQIEVEASRAASMVAVGDQIIRNQEIQLRAVDLFAKHGNSVHHYLPMLPGGNKPGGA